MLRIKLWINISIGCTCKCEINKSFVAQMILSVVVAINKPVIAPTRYFAFVSFVINKMSSTKILFAKKTKIKLEQ